MLQEITPDEVGLDGRAMEIRYHEEPGRPDLLVVSITYHAVEGGPAHVTRSEVVLVAVEERVQRRLLWSRVRAEAARRGVGRVAWIREA